MYNWIRELYKDPRLLKKGHCQRQEDLSLGMGWLYYGFTRLIRPQNVVVIGSAHGFSPLVFSKALSDNTEAGIVHFIDPSLYNDFWKDATKVSMYFNSYNADNIQHHLMTTQEFVESEIYRELDEVGIVFIDGLHTKEQAKFDYLSFKDKLADDGIIMFHDSISTKKSRMYGPDNEYQYGVKLLIDELREESDLQILDIPFANGLTIVRMA